MNTWNIVINWAIFLGKVSLAVIALILIHKLYRYVRAYKKRFWAVRKLRKTAKKNGYECRRRGHHFFNLRRNNMRTAFILTRGNETYNVRFLANIYKNKTLRFYAPDAYVSEKEIGYTLMLGKRAATMMIIAKLFKPDNMSDDLMQITHTEIVTFPSKTIFTKGVEIIKGGSEHDIVILNPVPLKAFVLDKTVWKEIVGGETWQNLSFHDISSFCNLLEHSK